MRKGPKTVAGTWKASKMVVIIYFSPTRLRIPKAQDLIDFTHCYFQNSAQNVVNS